VPHRMVSEDEYLNVLNSELRKETAYRDGMEFIAHPPGATGADITGYAWIGPMDVNPGVYARAAVRAAQSYSIQVTPRNPRA
jgi:hypothetical protein